MQKGVRRTRECTQQYNAEVETSAVNRTGGERCTPMQRAAARKRIDGSILDHIAHIHDRCLTVYTRSAPIVGCRGRTSAQSTHVTKVGARGPAGPSPTDIHNACSSRAGTFKKGGGGNRDPPPKGGRVHSSPGTPERPSGPLLAPGTHPWRRRGGRYRTLRASFAPAQAKGFTPGSTLTKAQPQPPPCPNHREPTQAAAHGCQDVPKGVGAPLYTHGDHAQRMVPRQGHTQPPGVRRPHETTHCTQGAGYCYMNWFTPPCCKT